MWKELNCTERGGYSQHSVRSREKAGGNTSGFEHLVPAAPEGLLSHCSLSTVLIQISSDLMNCQNLSLTFILELS